MIRILNIEPDDYSDEARAILKRLGCLVEEPLSRKELLTRVADFEVLIVRLKHQIDREVIDAAKNLRVIVTATTGLDHIEVDYAEKKGVVLLSLRRRPEMLRDLVATCEHTWALLLSLIRRIPQATASTCAGHWSRDWFRGRELAGNRLGIVGLGRIGHRVARYGQAFGMEVAAYDPYVRHWVDGVERASTLEGLLSRTEILTLHIPLTKQTYGLFGREQFSSLPGGSLFINTSRGDLVDESALLEALKSGHLSGAALDVICNERDETLRRGSRLLAYARCHDNLLITPHIGGATIESMTKTELLMANALAEFLGAPGKVDTARTGLLSAVSGS